VLNKKLLKSAMAFHHQNSTAVFNAPLCILIVDICDSKKVTNNWLRPIISRNCKHTCHDINYIFAACNIAFFSC